MLKQPFQTQVTKRTLDHLYKLEHNFIPVLFLVSDLFFLKIVFCLGEVPDWQTDSRRQSSHVFLYTISTIWREPTKLSTKVTSEIRFILKRQHLKKNKLLFFLCSIKCNDIDLLSPKLYLAKMAYRKCLFLGPRICSLLRFEENVVQTSLRRYYYSRNTGYKNLLHVF